MIKMTIAERQAVCALLRAEPASGEATPEQILAVAQEYEMEPHALEGFYLVAVDKLADA